MLAKVGHREADPSVEVSGKKSDFFFHSIFCLQSQNRHGPHEQQRELFLSLDEVTVKWVGLEVQRTDALL